MEIRRLLHGESLNLLITRKELKRSNFLQFFMHDRTQKQTYKMGLSYFSFSVCVVCVGATNYTNFYRRHLNFI